MVLSAWWEDLFRCKAEPDHQWTLFDFSDGTASLPRSVFLDSGGFDEQFGRGQDWDLGLRLLERGVPFAYYPAARSWHHVDSSLTTSLGVARATARADVRLAAKHPHVTGRLTVASYAAHNGDVARRHLLAYRHAERAEQLTPLGLVALDHLEALKLPRAWSRLFRALWTQAYITGLKDALPTRAEFQTFLGAVPRNDSLDTLSVTIDRPSRLRLPSRQAALDVSVAWNGEHIARVPATEPGEQWSWDSLARRVVDHSLHPRLDALLTAHRGLPAADHAL
jgi:hypothetical protein